MSLHAPQPDRAAAAREAWQLGTALASKKEWEAAAKHFRHAVACAPQDALYWLNLANAARHRGAYSEAESAARTSLSLEPGQLLARQILAEALSRQYRPQEAVQVYEEMQAAGQHDAASLMRHAAALLQLLRPQPAVPLLLQALVLDPASTSAHALLADALSNQGLKREAVECLRTVVALAPEHLEARVRLTYELRQACDWSILDEELQAITALLGRQGPAQPGHTAVFSLLSLPIAPELQLQAAASEAAVHATQVKPLGPVTPGPMPGRWRIGMLSFDFRNHPVSQLLVEVLEHLDKSQFELFLYSYGPDDRTPLRARMQRAADHFVELGGMSDEQAAARIREDGVALLFDLMGFTRGTRPAILAYRPAPIQAGYLGFPGSCGAPYIDYLVGDEVVTPLALAPLYTEKLAQLPRCVLPNGRWRPLPQRGGQALAAAREAAGLPADAFVLCAFNQSYKILPAMFDAWCHVLDAVPQAVLWLNESNPQMRENVMAHAARRRIDPDRLRFARRVSYEEHFSRLALADLFVDTWPYNGHTTVADALWAGVPVVTLSGNSYASRVAASALDAVGLGELAFMDIDDYVAAAVTLARSPELLAGYRQHLDSRRLSAPLFDAPGYAADLQHLMLRMLQRWQAGLPPAPLEALHSPQEAAMPLAA